MRTGYISGGIVLLGWLLSSSVQAQDRVYACTYTDKHSGTLEQLSRCALDEKGKWHFLQDLFANSVRQDNGLIWATLMTQGKAEQDPDYYINARGDALSVVRFDNGPDGFSEGVVRSRAQGKIGYFDAQFRQVIPRKFDFAWPFEQGKALVCIGCAPQREVGGEHTALVGGDWFYIDKKGQRISEIQHRPF